MKVKVMADGRLSLPASVRRKHGLLHGGEVIVEEVDGAIVLRTLDEVVRRAQAISRRLTAGKNASVDDFLEDRSGDDDS